MAEEKVYKAIGIMSGTSLDGLDLALVETDGKTFVRPLASYAASYDYVPELKDAIRSCFGMMVDSDGRMARAGYMLTLFVNEVLKAFLEREGLKPSDIDVLGFHGQTVFHDPAQGFTWQIGDGGVLAEESGIDVVFDFRKEDMEEGGQGAPLLPLYHHMLVKEAGISDPCLVLNIGGVSNLTLVQGAPEELIAFDCGPGNALMDDEVKAWSGKSFDEGGAMAARGRVHQELVDKWMGAPYFAAPYPKSLDRDEWNLGDLMFLSLEDRLATLAEFTARSIKAGVDLLPVKPAQVIVCGGGRRNDHVMARLADLLGVPVKSSDEFGWDGDFVEAEGFGFFAVRSLLDLPISYPQTTGCSEPTVGGEHFFAAR